MTGAGGKKLDGTFPEHLVKSIKATSIKAIGKMLPKGVMEEVNRYRACTARERPIYLRMRISNGIGLTNPKRLRPSNTARSYVFVCFGNIMRSPMCEALMKRAVAAEREIAVTSAGLNATPGRAAHPWAVKAAGEFGVSLDGHRARVLTDEMVNQADVIFAMDYQNQVQLLSRYSHAKNKVFMLSAYAGEGYHPVEIGDPYYSGEEGTRDCYKILDTCVRNLVSSLSPAKSSM